MSYIGKQPVVGNFQKCDAITVVNGQAAYTLNVGGAAVTHENANHMLVSLNGVLQAPGDSFTVSGSTLTFASNLATGDVIDFVIILGDVLDLGTPSDNSISTAKLVANSVTAAKFNADVISGQTALAEAPADTDEFLVSDGGVIKRIDFSHIKGGGAFEKLVTTTVSSSTSSVEFDNTYLTTAHRDYRVIVTGMKTSLHTGKFQMQISSDNGSSFDSSSNYNQNAFGGRSSSGGSNSPTGVNYQDGSHFQIIGPAEPIGADTGESSHFHIDIFDPLNQNSDSQFLTVMWNCVIMDADAKVNRGLGAGVFDDSGSEDTVFNAIKFFLSAGTIEGGSFTLYGRKI